MKKKQFTIAAILSASLLLSACGAASSEPSVTTQPIASTQAQAASASQETSVAVQQPSSTAQTAPAQGESVAISTEGQTAAETSLSEEEAKQIAFDHAGVQEADVTGLRIGLDYDDGVRKYDVEFYSGNKEYDYDEIYRISDKTVNKEIELIIDEELLEVDYIAFHPLYNGMSIFLPPKECFKFLDSIGRDAKVMSIKTMDQEKVLIKNN